VTELSDVLWHFFLQLPMQSPGVKLRWLMLFCAWSLWAALTVAILLLMEGLSAFLHTLRLHWYHPQTCIKYSRFITCQSNTSKGRGHDRLPN